MSEEDFHLSSQRTLRRTRDGPPGRLYKFAGLREIPNLVAPSPLQEEFKLLTCIQKIGLGVVGAMLQGIESDALISDNYLIRCI